MTQPKDIEGLRKVAEEATPGPWEVWPYGGDPRVVNSEIGWTIYTNEDPDEAQRPQLDANARYIAAASPDVVLALLSELEAVKGERDEAFDKLGAEIVALREDLDAAEAALVSLKGGGGSSVAESGSTASPKSDGLCKSEGGE